MTGERANSWETGETGYKHAYYDGRIDRYCDQYEGILGGGNRLTPALRDAYPPESTIEPLLVPQGPMVDGTEGRPVNAVLKLGDDGKWRFNVRGVYPGTYGATARLTTPAGETVPLRLSLTPRGRSSREPGSTTRSWWTGSPRWCSISSRTTWDRRRASA